MAGSGGYLNGTLAWSPDGTRLADAGRRGTSVWSLTDRSAPVFAVERDGTTADLAQALIDEGGCAPHPSVTPRRVLRELGAEPTSRQQRLPWSPSRTIEPQMEDAGTAAREA